jgi:hypothetical protein
MKTDDSSIYSGGQRQRSGSTTAGRRRRGGKRSGEGDLILSNGKVVADGRLSGGAGKVVVRVGESIRKGTKFRGGGGQGGEGRREGRAEGGYGSTFVCRALNILIRTCNRRVEKIGESGRGVEKLTISIQLTRSAEGNKR